MADEIERYVSPDGRLVLERHLAYDPADLHEIAPQRRAVVRAAGPGAESGATLIDLRRFDGGSEFAWTADGGLALDCVNAVRIVVAPGANADLSPEFIGDHAAAIAGAGVLLAQLEVPVPAVRAAMQLARGAGVPTLLNPAPADAATTPDLLASCDILVPNETEFAALVHRHLGDALPAEAVAGFDDATLHALCRQLLPAGRVVVTLGAAGCFVSHPDTAPDHAGGGGPIAFQRFAAQPVAVRDATGAGDAFCGALAASLALDRRAPFGHHVRFANRYAALSSERPGAAVAMPKRGELVARFGD